MRLISCSLLFCAACLVLIEIPLRFAGGHISLRPRMINHGEALLHGVPDEDVFDFPVSYDMPVAPVADALIYDHAPKPFRWLGLIAINLLCLLLTWQLGEMLLSPVAGSTGALIMAFLLFRQDSAGYAEALLTFSILAAANALCWRAKSPSPARSALLGLAVGASLLVKSPLFLFPFILVLYELIFKKTRDIKERMVDWLVITAIPLLMLAPWMALNLRLYHRFILFENGRADANVISGALGIVHALYGNTHVPNWPKQLGNLSPIRWAATTVVRHPFRYLAAFGARLCYAVSLHPLAVILAALFLRIYPSAENKDVCLLAAYFFAIYCLMPVTDRYFTPITPIFAALAGCAVAFPFVPATQSKRPVFLWAAFIPYAALAALTLGLVLAYPKRSSAGPASMDRALASFPNDSWLWQQQGIYDLRARRFKKAAQNFRRSLKIRPDPRTEMDYAWTLLAQGGPSRDLALHLAVYGDKKTQWRLYLLKTLAAFKDGDFPAARAAFRAAEGEWHEILFASSAWPDIWSTPLCTIELPKLAAPLQHPLSTDKTDDFARCFAAAELDAALQRQNSGNYPEAIHILKNLRRQFPDDAKYASDLGVCLYLAGATHQAAGYFMKAIDLKPNFLPAYLSLAAVYARAHDYRRALQEYNLALAHGGKTDALMAVAAKSKKDLLDLSR